jgi:hypothetical protein
VFPFNFSASSAEEVAVIRMTAADEPTELTGYTVTINDNGGGSIHFTTAPAVGDPIYIVSRSKLRAAIYVQQPGRVLMRRR